MLKLTRPLHLLLAALTYTLGASVSAYLGKPPHLLAFGLGLLIVLSAQASMSLLSEAFRPHNEPLLVGETPQQKETLRANLPPLAVLARLYKRIHHPEELLVLVVDLLDPCCQILRPSYCHVNLLSFP